MQITILSTKLFVPQPHRDIVPRPRLLERLDAGLHGKLTLVSAPAGYGKTTLVSDWIVHSQVQSTWLSLDATDNDIARFFSYLIAALQQIDPGIGITVQPILESDVTPPVEVEYLLTALVNDVAAFGEEFTLILDDYHVIHDIKIHQALDFLFDHIPPRMHVVIISRTDPPMPLGRLRVLRQLTEIREDDLRFTVDETVVFFNEVMGFALSPQEIEDLEARTEGWIAGLQLAALTIQDRPDHQKQITAITGSHRYLIDYLTHEVMSRQPERVQKFLRHTSILERFNASLCDAILDEVPKPEGGSVPEASIAPDPSSFSRQTLDYLEKVNLFLVPLDDKRQWYRYHHLFSEFLRRRLHDKDPEIISELLTRASRWYETQGMVDEAIEHAISAGDVMRSAHLLDSVIETYVLVDAAVNKVIQWADKLPVRIRAQFPRLCIWHAWALQFEMHLGQVEPVLAMAEAHLEKPQNLPSTYPVALITAYTNVVRTYMEFHRKEYDKSVEISLEILNGLSGEETKQIVTIQGLVGLALGTAYYGLGRMDTAYSVIQKALSLNLHLGYQFTSLSCLFILVNIDVPKGLLNLAQRNVEKGMFWIEEWSREKQGKRLTRMLAHLRWRLSRIEYERNKLAQAIKILEQANEFYELTQSWYRVYSYYDLGKVHLALGNTDISLRFLRKLEQTALTLESTTPGASPDAMIVDLKLSLSQSQISQRDFVTEIVLWKQASDLQMSGTLQYNQEYEYRILAQVLLSQGEVVKASRLLERLITCAESAGRMGELIAYLSLQATAKYRLGDTRPALITLARALEIGELEGYVRTFVDIGKPMRDLLQVAAQRNSVPHKEYVSKLLAAFPHTEPDIFLSPTVQDKRQETGNLIEPLNDREMQILRLLPAGLTNRQIADELYLSINTIKWYTTQIYGKLDVSKRAEAVSRAYELNML